MSRKSDIGQWKKYQRKIDEESLQLYALVQKSTEKLMN